MDKILDIDYIMVVDFCKWQVKYGIMAIILFITFICCLDESCHATELNQLPVNRTEIYNIHNVTIEHEHNQFIVGFNCNYIYPVSLESHFNLTKLFIQTETENYTYFTNESNKYFPRRSVTWIYNCPATGNATVKFYRSKTLIHEQNFTNLT